jgi:tetratricopeptide (TPR) repeat protein
MTPRSAIIIAAACAALALPLHGAPAPRTPQGISKPGPLAPPPASASWEQDHDAGNQAFKRRDLAEAERLWHSALRKATQAHPHNAQPAAVCHRKLAELYLSLGRHAEAARHHQGYFDSVGTPMPHKAQVGDMASGYGACLLALKRLDLADAWLTRAMEILPRTLAADHIELGDAYARLARVRAAQARPADAATLFARALPIYQKSHGPDSRPTLRLMLETGDALRLSGGADKAFTLYRRAFELHQADRSPDPSILASASERMAQIRITQSRFREAANLLREARLNYVKRFGPGHRSVITLDLRFARLFSARRHFDEAESLCRSAIEASRRSFGEKHEAYAASLLALAEVYRLQRDLASAEPLFKSGVAISLRSKPLADRSVRRALWSYAQLLRDSYRHEQVPALYAQAKSMRAQHEKPAVASAGSK